MTKACCLADRKLVKWVETRWLTFPGSVVQFERGVNGAGLNETISYCRPDILCRDFYTTPTKQSCGNQLIHRSLTKTKLIGRGPRYKESDRQTARRLSWWMVLLNECLLSAR